jgi:hypothetical protein
MWTTRQPAPIKSRGVERKQNMKKTLALICLSFMLSSAAFAGSSRENLQSRIDAAKAVTGRDHGRPGQEHSDGHSSAGHLRCRGAGNDEGSLYLRRAVWPGSGDLPHRPRLERAGVSFAWRADRSDFRSGGQATDLVLIAVNERGLQDLLKSKFKMGGDASAAAGPVGRAGQASTDWKMGAELLSYSRNKGLFAGIDLDGTSVSQNREDTELYYGKAHNFESVLKGNVPVPPGAVEFVRA